MDKIIKLSSKRNLVYLINNNEKLEVVKKFKEKESFKKEIKIYQLIKKENGNNILKYPEILDFDEKELTIRLKYIEGYTLLDSFEKYEKSKEVDSAVKLLTSLFEWIDVFHQSLTKRVYIEELLSVGIILSNEEIEKKESTISIIDTNFKNFIRDDNQLYGLDFESVNLEKRVTDYAKALAYMLTYNPIASEFKKEVYNYLFKLITVKYNLSDNELYQALKNEIRKIEIRRNINIEKF